MGVIGTANLQEKPLYVAVVGSRNYPRIHYVRWVIASLPPYAVIVSGGARGVDREAEKQAALHRLPKPVVYYPDWERLGKRAGYIRNQDIIKKADIVFAFWDGTSPGTLSSIHIAQHLEKPLRIIRPGDLE